MYVRFCEFGVPSIVQKSKSLKNNYGHDDLARIPLSMCESEKEVFLLSILCDVTFFFPFRICMTDWIR